MILRIVHAATLPEKKQAYIDFVNSTIAPTLRKAPGCKFVYVADCVEKGHEQELIWVSGWDKMGDTEALESGNVYPGIANKAKTFFTERFSEHGALHIHYRTFADFA